MGKSESQMDIMEKSSKPGKRRWTVTEISLSVLLLMVSCALAGIVVLYTSVVKGNEKAAWPNSLSAVSVFIRRYALLPTTAAKISTSFTFHLFVSFTFALIVSTII